MSFTCGLLDHFISTCQKPLKEVRWLAIIIVVMPYLRRITKFATLAG